jgi:N12 class adenine-specific DNA methylase/uncharacterized membrane-anchored protein YhcB (DUF1043 family)
VLAGYTGWGSFGQELFQGSWRYPHPKDGWEARDKWLRDNLGQAEWEGLQRSIINAHYTDPPTVLAMWDMVRRLGFPGGRVLEPSIGVGNFFGMMPPDLTERSHRAGIELDPVTGSIAQYLYPNANIQIKGYEKSDTPDNFYDLVIGNWPFADFSPADRRYNRLNPLLHDYFFLKALDQTRPGGLVVGITSKGTMDKKAATIRRELAKKGELVAAFRLPTGAFEEYAGTKVVTDIIILKKRAEEKGNVADEGWVKVKDYQTPSGETVPLNEYYHTHPDHVLGTIDFGHGTTTGRPGMIVHRSDNMAERLRQAVAMVPEKAWQPTQPAKKISFIANHTDDRNGSLVKTKDGLFIVQGEYLAPATDVANYRVKDPATTAKREDQLSRLVALRKLYGQLVDAERVGEAEKERKALRDAYQAFTKEHGPLSDSYGLNYLKKVDDPFHPALAALETRTEGAKGKVTYRPAAILSESTVRGAREILSPSIADAFVLARTEAVSPTPERIAELAGEPVEDVRRELIEKGAAFETPDGALVPADLYLSGNVREKRRQARAGLAAGNQAMQRNLDALEKVVPPDIPYYQIETQMGATWVPPRVYADFIAHMLGLDSAADIDVRFEGGNWMIDFPGAYNHRTEANSGWGVPHREVPFKRLVRAAIANQTITIRRKDSDGNWYVATDDTKETNAKIAEMRSKFGEWLWSDPVRRVEMEGEYNESRNSYATPKFDGSFLPFQGMALSIGRGPFQLRQHQVDAIWRGLVTRKSLNAHEVGTGKTFTMGGIAVESRRYGLAKKPMLLAHNANSKSVAAEIQQMYPGAQVLYIDNLSKDNIKVRMLQIANDDWDVIVVPHSVIDRFGFKSETLLAMAQPELDALEAAAIEAADEDGATLTPEMLDNEEELKKLRSVTAKRLVRARFQIIQRIEKMAQQASRADSVAFEDLGVDMLLVDEAHEFKKPPIATKMKMKGLQTETSNRSITAQFMTKYVRDHNNGGNVHLFTGTPITNTLTEIFHMMRYIMQEEMEKLSLADWDGWFGSFAREIDDIEMSSTGEFEAVTRLQSFINVPELRRMIGQYMDVVFADDMPEMQPRRVNGKTLADKTLTEAERAELLNGRTEGAADRPYKKVINLSADMTPEQIPIFEKVRALAQRWRNMHGKERRDAMAAGDPVVPIVHDAIAEKASFDVRLVDAERNAGKEGTPELAQHPDSKPARVVKNVLDIYRSHPQAAQVVFMEQGMSQRLTRSVGPAGEKVKMSYPAFSTLYDMIERLVQAGVPRDEIAVVTGATSKDERKLIAEQMNDGRKRIVFGSTDALGVGVNMQRNLRAMHHMDAPWMPGELEQRNGRGHRQGNQWNTVLEFRYLTDRLDGRRWQVLAIKQRFITDFMKSKGDVRVIEGEAASDEASDILSTFSDAAGDPRVLLREKLKKKVEQLQSRERIHSHGKADALRAIRRLDENIARDEKRLAALRESGAIEKARELVEMQRGDTFRAQIFGQSFEKSTDANDFLKKQVPAQMRIGEDRIIGSYGPYRLGAHWDELDSEPDLYIEGIGNQTVETDGLGMQKLLFAVRRVADIGDDIAMHLAEAQRERAHLKNVAEQPFHLADQLIEAQKKFSALHADIEKNPVAPPYWLRVGAAVDTKVLWNGNEFTVTGHRWDNNGYWVMAEDPRGEVAIPYNEVTDEQGMPLYEEHEFTKPKVIEKQGQEAPPTEPGEDQITIKTDEKLHTVTATIYGPDYVVNGTGRSVAEAVAKARAQKPGGLGEESEDYGAAERGKRPQLLREQRKLPPSQQRELAKYPTHERILDAIRGKLTDMQPSLLAAVPLNYFTELKQPNMTAVDEYLKLKRAMDAYRGKKHEEMDKLANRWRKVGKANTLTLSQLMHDATRAGIDPDKAKPEDADMPLVQRFAKLPPKVKEIYREVRDAYQAMANETDKLLLDNVAKAQEIAQRQAAKAYKRETERIRANTKMTALEKSNALDLARKEYDEAATRAVWSAKGRVSRLRIMFEQRKVPDPYFPLTRFGRYFVTVRDADGEVVSFSRRETAFERNRLVRMMKRDPAMKGMTIDAGVLDERNGFRDAMDPRFVAQVEKILSDTGADPQTMDLIWQHYLQTLPDLSMRKRYLSRKGTAGYHEDALRVFGSHMFHAAHQLGRLKYGLELREAVNDAADQARESKTDQGTTLANELRKRNEWVLNPTGSRLAQRLTSIAFLYYLGATPAAAAINLTQTPMLGIPILAGRFGSFTKATAALARASRNIAGDSGLTDEEKRAMQSFYDSGLIDRTMSHDLAGIGDVGVAYNPLRSRAMAVVSALFHNAEIANRRVTALAAFRLARKAGQRFEEAVDTAHDVTWKTHFDYSNSSRPRMAQNDFVKVAFTFKTHQLNMIYRMARDFCQMIKGATPQARREARYQFAGILGMQALLAGATGVFGYNTAMWTASMVMAIVNAITGDDDDDPFDLDQRFRAAILDLLGPNWGGQVLNGVPGSYLGIDLTSRIGMADIWLRSPNKDLEGEEEYNYWFMQVMGAVPSLGKDVFRGLQYLTSGDLRRALQVATPKFMRDLAKSYKYYNEGVTTLYGDSVVDRDNLSSWDLVAQFLGFTPARVAEAWDRNAALKTAESRVNKQRQTLINSYALSARLGDLEAKKEALDRIRRFNKTEIGRTVPIKPETLARSLKMRAVNAKKRQGGVLIENLRLGKELRERLPQAIY